MATGYVLLTPESARMPDGSAGNAAPGGPVSAKSSAAAPSPFRSKLLFDATTKEMCMWSFEMPGDYASGPIFKVQYAMASATSGNVVVESRVAAISDGDATDVDAKAFGAANTSAATTVPATAGFIDEISLTLTNADSLAANDNTVVYFARDAANASDTATGDLEFLQGRLDYTTT